MDAPQTFDAFGTPSASSAGAVLTAPGSANTKGAWLELVTATTRDAVAVVLSGQLTVTSGAAFGLVDIGIGASGSETVLVPNIPLGRLSTNPFAGDPVYLPVPRIPAGARISARYQTDNTGGAQCTLAGTLIAPTADTLHDVGSVSALGATTAASKGTTIDPGTTAHAKGAWVQMSAAAPCTSRWAVLSVMHDAPVDYGYAWRVDIGIGAAASEVVVVPDITIHSSATGGLGVVRVALPLQVREGERIALRAQSSATNGSRVLTAILHLIG